MSYAKHLIDRELGRKAGLEEDYRQDPTVNVEVRILAHHAEAFERACELEGLEREQIEHILATFIYGAMPNHVQATDRMELSEAFKAHLMNCGPAPMLFEHGVQQRWNIDELGRRG